MIQQILFSINSTKGLCQKKPKMSFPLCSQEAAATIQFIELVEEQGQEEILTSVSNPKKAVDPTGCLTSGSTPHRFLHVPSLEK